jgi:hypothetical protein
MAGDQRAHLRPVARAVVLAVTTSHAPRPDPAYLRPFPCLSTRTRTLDLSAADQHNGVSTTASPCTSPRQHEDGTRPPIARFVRSSSPS